MSISSKLDRRPNETFIGAGSNKETDDAGYGGSRKPLRTAKWTAPPFFIEVAYNAVHWPFQPPDLPPSDRRRDRGHAPLRQMPDDQTAATRQDYVAMLERADQGVGRILATLERHRVAQDALVIFTNDNGGEWLSRNAPLFNRKATLWEGGIRVPLILRWPGHLPRGKSSDQVAITMDLMASILAATGTALRMVIDPPG